MLVQLKQSFFPFMVLLGAVVLYALFFYDFRIPPYEDAAMLMRYASHLAQGHGIVWNPGEAPVDGATDFLFMVAVAGMYHLGFSLKLGVGLLIGLSHVLTGWVVFREICRELEEKMLSLQASRGIALGVTAFLLIGPGLVYLESSFGTPFFALWAVLAWREALQMTVGPIGRGQALRFSLLGLLTGLTRPEGVFLAGFMWLAVLWYRRGAGTKGLIFHFVWVFGLLGGGYFAWHWAYFGYPLPNPFYIKGGGSLHLHSLKRSVIHLLYLAGPVLLLYFYGFWQVEHRRQVIFRLLPVLGFVLIWVLMSNAMNYFMRFQYVCLPLLALGLGGILPGKVNSARWLGVLLLALAGALCYQHFQYANGVRFHRDGRFELACELQPFASKNYTLAVSEAGILPLYSQWRSIDTWGLNDRQIAHAGIVTAEYLDRFAPEIIMYRDDFVPGGQPRRVDPDWSDMCAVLHGYAQSREYVLAAVFGATREYGHWYWVRRDFADSERMVELIRNREYGWYEGDEAAVGKDWR